MQTGSPNPITKIILTTINARYYHTAFGLRWLRANLGALRADTAIREFHSGQPAMEIVESLLRESPAILGLGVYIWNFSAITEVARTIKALRPETVLVLGGPEISHAYEGTELFAACDYLVRGEGERAFAELARAIPEGRRPEGKVIEGGEAELDALRPPYDEYTEEDLARRKIYVEASRGCPFRCEFCLSALGSRVREFPLEPFFDSMGRLIERGAREFIYVDRTFNLNTERALAILDFFRGRGRMDLRLHFEIVPDRLEPPLLEAIAQWPAGALHLEAGIQTLNPEVQAAISRRQNIVKTLENMRFLRERTGAWVHADLIIGLPGESWESFAAGFDRLAELRPQQIQVGTLKRLKGAPIARHDRSGGMIYAATPPYEILAHGAIGFAEMQRLKRMARFFDLYYNSGNFPESLERLWRARGSAFESMMGLADWVWARTGRTHEISLIELARQLFDFMKNFVEESEAAAAVERDYRRVPGRKEKNILDSPMSN